MKVDGLEANILILDIIDDFDINKLMRNLCENCSKPR